MASNKTTMDMTLSNLEGVKATINYDINVIAHFSWLLRVKMWIGVKFLQLGFKIIGIEVAVVKEIEEES